MADIAHQIEELNAADVRKRVDDWERRVRTLYQSAEEWLRDIDGGYSVNTGETVTIHEELMQRFAVPPRSLPVMSISREDKRILTLKPMALWVIAGNGRIDVVGRKSAALLVDRAPAFEPPRWELYFLGERRISGRKIRSGRPFDRDALATLLADNSE